MKNSPQDPAAKALPLTVGERVLIDFIRDNFEPGAWHTAVQRLADSEERKNGKPPACISGGLKTVLAARRDCYGDPARECERVASLLYTLFGWNVLVTDVPLVLICLKLVREQHHHQADNLRDVAGYAECAANCHGESVL
jgi:hypothetical protein